MTIPAFATSHSALKQFEQCARQYHEVKVLKRFPYVQGAAQKYGDALHKAIELNIKNQEPIPSQFKDAVPVVEAMMKKGGRKHAELAMALDLDLKPVSFFDKRVWVRGKADIVIEQGKHAFVGDWKTGNPNYPDYDQLKLMSMMTFAYYPEVDDVRSAAIYIGKDRMYKYRLNRRDLDAAWWWYRERVARLQGAYDADVWNPNQSGLCKYCPVTDCEYWRERK